MAILQTKRQSDLEKRLLILRRQVYGKVETAKTETKISSDPTYVNQDLLKILIFSSLAIGVQIFLYVLSKNHLINLFFK